jgi:hypothetical protein
MAAFARRAFIAGGLAAGGLAQPPPARAQSPSRPVVLELFTSQGCSSCPPADALLRELARTRADLLPLAFHVTYWDRLGWPDRFALPEATARQRGYARLSHLGTIYTPQLVVDGRTDVIGSDRHAVLAAIAAARPVSAAALSLAADGPRLIMELGAGQGAGEILLVGFDPEHTTPVRRGENAGRALVEANIVRALLPLGPWHGAPRHLAVPRPPGERHAVLVQAADGSYLAAALAPTSPA